MRWHRCCPRNAGSLGRDKVLRMKAKRNRYDLSLWDVRKLSLYGSAQERVQAATLIGRTNLGGTEPSVGPNSVQPGFGQTNIGQTRGSSPASPAPMAQNQRLLHGDGLDNSTSTKTE